MDDPNDAAAGEADRKSITTWWDDAACNRLNDLRTDNRCIIQQRLHEEDLTGHILRKDRVLIIRNEWEPPGPRDPDIIPTSLGWSDPRSVPGALTFPERFPATSVRARSA